MKYFYQLLLLLSCLPAGAQSLYEKYERFLTTPRTYVCYRADGKLKMDGKLNESSWRQAIWEEKVAFDKQIRKGYLPMQRKIQQRASTMPNPEPH